MAARCVCSTRCLCTACASEAPPTKVRSAWWLLAADKKTECDVVTESSVLANWRGFIGSVFLQHLLWFQSVGWGLLLSPIFIAGSMTAIRRELKALVGGFVVLRSAEAEEAHSGPTPVAAVHPKPSAGQRRLQATGQPR